MGIHPDLAVLVYENGMGVYIHKLFAQRYNIKPGATVHPSVLLKHEEVIPFSERARMKSWIHPDDRHIAARGNPVFWKHVHPPIQPEIESD